MRTTMDDRGEGVENGTQTGSVKAAIHRFQSNSSSSPMWKQHHKQPRMDFLQKQPSKVRELHLVKKSISDLNDNSRVVESKAQAELQLIRAKKTVKDLASQIEESSSRAKMNQSELEKLNEMRKSKVCSTFMEQKIENDHLYDVAWRELELLKKELSKLRLEIDLAKEETSRAYEEAEISKSKMGSYLTNIESLRKEIEEANEEQVLVELATIEALKELTTIEDQRREEASKYSSKMEEKRAKMNIMVDEINRAKKLEEKLVVVESDIDMLQSQLKSLREMEQMVECNGSSEHSGANLQELSLEWKSIIEEIEEGKKQLSLTRQEGFQVMATMDIIRREKINMAEEVTQMNKCIEKYDKMVRNLNSKLVRARIKLEAATTAEEKANGIMSSLSVTLEQLKTDTEASREQRKLLMEETENVKFETRRTESETDSKQDKLQAVLEELEMLGSSEVEALEKLKDLTEKAMRERATASQNKSTITISRFEYEYLCKCAAAAQETADKKVTAAQEWIAVLKAGEREARAKIEKVKNESRELRLKEEQEVYQTDKSLTAKELVQGEMQSQRDRWRRSSIEADDSKMTPSRRAKLRRSTSPASKHMSPRSTSFTVKRRRKVMPIIAKYFANMNIEKGSSLEEL